MTAPSGIQSRLLEIIDAGIIQAAQLKRVLEDERRALESQDSAALGTATDAKEACVAKLDALEAERRSVGRACGLSPDLSPLVPQESPPVGQPVAKRWEHYLSLAASCRDLNRTNGGIINLRRQQVAAALRIVSGTQSETYGPTGGEAISRSQRALTEV